MKNAYLVVTDLHYGVSKEHRLNYFGEVMSILQQVLDVSEKYKADGYRVHLLFLGDIVDGPLTRAEDALRCQSLFQWYTSQFSSCYTVLGNHEENNTSSNPFWFLIDSLADSELERQAKPLQPQGLSSVIRIGSTLVDGDFTIYFNHYGTQPKVPSTPGTHIGLFHQNVGSNQICKMWGTFTDVEEASFVRMYNYCFFGHMHLATGRYKLNEAGTCFGEWLGTCVGTTVTEVEQLPAKLNIPAILTEDGHFISVDDNYINRSQPAEVIDYARLAATKEAAKAVEAKQQASVAVAVGDTLLGRIKFASEGLGLLGVVELLTGSQERVLMDYKAGMNAVTLEEEGRSTDYERESGDGA